MLYVAINLVIQPYHATVANDQDKALITATISAIDAVYAQIAKDSANLNEETTQSKGLTENEKRQIKLEALHKVGSTRYV